MLEDRLLIWRFKCGDGEALCRIYRKYRTDLLRLAALLLHASGDAEASVTVDPTDGNQIARGFAVAEADIWFEIRDGNYSYTLSGNLEVDPDPVDDAIYSAEAFFRLRPQFGGMEAVILGADARDGPLTRTLSATGVLVPGLYRVELETRMVTRLRQPQDLTTSLAGSATIDNVLLVLAPTSSGATPTGTPAHKRLKPRSHMAIELTKEAEQALIESIKRYFAEHMDEDIGDLKASLLLDFCLKQIGPSIYNQAIADAQAYMNDKVADLDGSCYEPEFGYWES